MMTNGSSKENTINMNSKTRLLTTGLLLFLGLSAFAQCENWLESTQKEDAENAHVVYRDAYKAGDFDLAFENWKVAYKLAPAADGKRSSHYFDGVEIYKHFLKSEKDAEKIKEYKAKILELYDAAISCYENRGIGLKCASDECYQKKIGYTQGRKGADMFYSVNSLYSENLAALEEAMSNAGLDSEYIVFDPVSRIVVYQFQNGLLDAKKARELHKILEDIATHNIANNERLSSYYQQAWDAAKAQYGQIEGDIFDCEYFKNKYKPELEANPNDFELIKKVFNILKGRGCESDDAFLIELKQQYETWAAEENAKMMKELEEKNPALKAKRLYDEGDFEGAAKSYREAIEIEADEDKKASYHFSLASILFRKMNNLGEARSEARKAAKLRSGWGRPYMLIGDMYGKGARSCGDSWNQRLAILAAMEKYQYAKSIDPEVAEDANSRLSKYRASMPDKQEGFMRSVKAGDKETVGCWIGEKVTVRFK